MTPTPPVEEVKRYVLGWQQGNGPFDEPVPAMVAGNWSPDVTSYVRSTAYDAKCAEVERLEAEARSMHEVLTRRGKSHAPLMMANATIAALTARVQEVEARNASLEKDAWRYRWLLHNREVTFRDDGGLWVGTWKRAIGDTQGIIGARIDAAIDAAKGAG